MCISDWSSDVCSSDLLKIRELREKAEQAPGAKFAIRPFNDTVLSTGSVPLPVLEKRIDHFIADGRLEPERSEARRVGKECVSTCSFRWSPYPSIKKAPHQHTMLHKYSVTPISL